MIPENLYIDHKPQYEPKIDQIWVIVPFSRPHLLSNIRTNFNNQIFQNKKLVIVENGPAIGACKAQNFEPDVLLNSDTHQSLARNEALAHLKKHGGGYWANWDDDDYYGPNYLLELAHHAHKDHIIGKNQIFVENSKHELWLLTDLEESHYSNAIYGPTISGWVEDACEFEEIEWGEDTWWVAQMMQNGAKVYATSRYNFLYNRTDSGHTLTSTDYQFMQAMPKGLTTLGKVDYDLIHGAAFKGKAEYIERKPRQLTDNPAYFKLIEKFGESKPPF